MLGNEGNSERRRKKNNIKLMKERIKSKKMMESTNRLHHVKGNGKIKI